MISDKSKNLGNLIDPRRDFYIIKEKQWDLGGGDIYDKEGATVGKMKRKILSLRAEISVSEPDGSQVFTVTKKLASFRQSYEIKDSKGKVLGRTKKKLLAFRPRMWMEDANGKQTLLGQGSFMGWDFEIKNMQGKLIAEVSKTDRWRDVVLGGIFDRTDTYALHILDLDYDRSVLLGFVIAIDNSVHDK